VGEPALRSFLARKFYQVINKISDADIVDGARDFRLMRREMADAIVSIIFIGGIQLFCQGIMGQYIAKTYLEAKKRPHFIVAETNAEDVEKVK
jgi:ABC-type maltose transport system permease subunit